MNRDIQAKRWGNYFFTHALIPHGPYVYQADCSVSYATPDYLRVANQRSEAELPPYVYEIRNGLYYGQVECALRSLQSLLDNMKKTGLYDRAIIILHGDHGSHISELHPQVANLKTFTKQDYRATFSTLFAVKYPGSSFFVDERALPITYLLEEFMTVLPTYLSDTDSYTRFSPSGDADPEKIDSYVYFSGAFPLHRVDIDLFND